MPLLRPEQRPDALELFFSSSGRLSRAPYLAGMGGVLGVLWLYDRWAGGWPRLLTAWIVLAVLLFSGCCLTSRRLHDLGWAGWWTAAPWVLILLARPTSAGPGREVFAALLGMASVVLCALPGRATANRFGPGLTRGARTWPPGR